MPILPPRQQTQKYTLIQAKYGTCQQKEGVLRGGAAYITHPRAGIDSGDLSRIC